MLANRQTHVHCPGRTGLRPVLIALAVTGITLALLAINRIRLDLVGLFVLVSLGVTRSLPPADLFAGFSSPALIVIAGMLAMGEGLVASGATRRLAGWVQRGAGHHPRRLVAVLMVCAALPSAFLSDVGLTGLFIPVVRELHRRTGVPARHLLMPLGVAATLGGLLTMVGSVGNIVANAVLQAARQPPLGIFAITSLALVLLAFGMGFMLTVGPRLIPEGSAPLEQDAESWRQYVCEAILTSDSPWVGEPLGEVAWFTEHGLTVAGILRQHVWMPAVAQTRLAAGDGLLLMADPRTLLEAVDPEPGLVLAGDSPESTAARMTGLAAVTEMLVGPRSPWVGRTLVDLRVRNRWGCSVLGLFRDGHLLTQHLGRTRLAVGDLVLLQGEPAHLESVAAGAGLIPLTDPVTPRPTRPWMVWATPAVLLGSLLAAATGLVGLRVAMALGVGTMAALGTLSLPDAYRSIDWRLLVFVGGLLPLGTVLDHTGVTRLASQALAEWVHGPTGVYLALAALFGAAALLTQVLSNIATVVVLAPVALHVGMTLDVAPAPLVLAVVIAVSAAPITPLANKVDLLIMGPGGFRYGDFLRIGLPLTVLLGAVTVGLLAGHPPVGLQPHGL